MLIDVFGLIGLKLSKLLGFIIKVFCVKSNWFSQLYLLLKALKVIESPKSITFANDVLGLRRLNNSKK